MESLIGNCSSNIYHFLFIVSPVTKTFSVLSQREDTSKSSAITDKWDGKGKIVDMIWE